MYKSILAFIDKVTAINPFTSAKKYKHKKYIKRLSYALEELDKPDEWMDEYVRESKKEAVLWLLNHYKNKGPFYKIEPKQRIIEVLNMDTKDFTPKDKVYLKILNYWCTFKRVEGF